MNNDGWTNYTPLLECRQAESCREIKVEKRPKKRLNQGAVKYESVKELHIERTENLRRQTRNRERTNCDRRSAGKHDR